MSASHVDTVPFILMLKKKFIHHFQLCELFSIHCTACLGHLINFGFFDPS